MCFQRGWHLAFPCDDALGCDDHDWLSVQPFGKLVWDLVQPFVQDWIDHDWSILYQKHPVAVGCDLLKGKVMTHCHYPV